MRPLEEFSPLARAGEEAKRAKMRDLILRTVKEEKGVILRVAERLMKNKDRRNLYDAARNLGIDLDAEAAKYRE